MRFFFSLINGSVFVCREATSLLYSCNFFLVQWSITFVPCEGLVGLWTQTFWVFQSSGGAFSCTHAPLTHCLYDNLTTVFNSVSCHKVCIFVFEMS